MKFLENCPVDVLKIVEDFDPGFFYFNFNQKILKTIEAETTFPPVLSNLVCTFCPIKKLFELDNSGFLMCADNEEEIENLFRIEEEEGKADSFNSLKSLLTNCGDLYDWNVHLIQAGLHPGHSTYPPGYVRDIKLLPLQDNYRISIKEEEDIPDYLTEYYYEKEEEEYRFEFATITCAFTDIGYAGWIEDTNYSREEIQYYLGTSPF